MSSSREQLEDLISRHFDGALNADEERELAKALADSREARALMASYLRLEGGAAYLGKVERLSGDAKENTEESKPQLRRHSSKRQRAAGPAWGAWVAAAACIALAFGLWTYFKRAPIQPEISPLARLATASPGVIVTRGGSRIPGEANAALFSGDSIEVPKDAKATIAYSGEATTLDVASVSTLSLGLNERGKRVELKAGMLEASVAKQPPGQALVFVTPNAQAEVLGTRLSLRADVSATRLEVSEGRVRFSSGTEAVEVATRQYAEAKAGARLAALPLEPAPPVSVATAPPLPAPSGRIERVANVEELTRAVRGVAPGTTILIAPGTYRLTNTLNITGTKNLTLRGATDNYNDVVLLGRGMAVKGGSEQGIQLLDVQDVLIANLSLGEFRDHPLHLHGADGCARVRMYNLRCFDAASNFLHATDNGPNRGGVVDASIDYCLFEYVQPFVTRDYAACINILNGRNWVIRNSTFRNLPLKTADANHFPAAILATNGSSNTLCEKNTFVNCVRGIAFGILPRKGYHDHSGGIIRNNFFFRDGLREGDAGIIVWDSPDTKVLHNTILLSGTYDNAIEYRFAGAARLEIANNLCDAAILERDGAQAKLAGNLTDAKPKMFVDAVKGDLHLRAGAAAIDRGVPVNDCAEDIDGQARTSTPDVGADEHVPAAN